MNKKWKVVGKKYIENAQKQLVASTIILKGSTLKKDEENETIAQENAHLIAAAPEMYEALEQAIQYFNDNGGNEAYTWLPKLTMALKKARGEL